MKSVKGKKHGFEEEMKATNHSGERGNNENHGSTKKDLNIDRSVEAAGRHLRNKCCKSSP